MMGDSPQQRLQRASDAWTRIFNNVKPLSKLQKSRPKCDNDTLTKSSISTTTTSGTAHAAPKSLTQQPIVITTSENLRRNQNWGDALSDKIDTHAIRIYAQNVNGIRLHKDGGQYKELCDIITEVKADVNSTCSSFRIEAYHSDLIVTVRNLKLCGH